jgi:hypothetical protein
LEVVTSELIQKGSLLNGFNPFGNHFQLQTVSHFDYGLDYGIGTAPRANLLHKRGIYLQSG